MRYRVKKIQKTGTTGYVQHSKKLSNWALLQWVLITIVVVAVLCFADLTESETDVLGSVVTWSATLAGVCVTGYMGNSSVEKYADRKFAIDETVSGKG